MVAGVLLHGFVKWPATLHIEIGSHPSKRNLKLTVGIRVGCQSVVSSAVVGFPPGLKAGIPSLKKMARVFELYIR